MVLIFWSKSSTKVCFYVLPAHCVKKGKITGQFVASEAIRFTGMPWSQVYGPTNTTPPGCTSYTACPPCHSSITTQIAMYIHVVSKGMAEKSDPLGSGSTEEEPSPLTHY